MHEDISHSGDGGIYGEALVNRAFKAPVHSLDLFQAPRETAYKALKIPYYHSVLSSRVGKE